MRVLHDISLTLSEGSSMLLLGANGAGKTTLLKSIIGLLPIEHGEINMFERRVDRLSAPRRVRLGVAFMSELGIFPSLSVHDNLRLGAHGASRRDIEERLEEAYASFPDLVNRKNALAGTLSGGQRKMVGISKCLMANPKVLLMDEPSAGLSPKYVDEVVEHLKVLRKSGITLLVAEQNVSFLAAADQACILEGGRINFSGSIDEFENNASLHEAFFGLEGTG